MLFIKCFVIFFCAFGLIQLPILLVRLIFSGKGAAMVQGTINVVTVLALIFLGITGPLLALLETMDLGVMQALKQYGFSFAILIMDLHFSWNLLYTFYIYPKLHHQPRPPKTGRALINGKYQLWVCIAVLALLCVGFEVFFVMGNTFFGCLLLCYGIYFLVIKKWDS